MNRLKSGRDGFLNRNTLEVVVATILKMVGNLLDDDKSLLKITVRLVNQPIKKYNKWWFDSYGCDQPILY